MKKTITTLSLILAFSTCATASFASTLNRFNPMVRATVMQRQTVPQAEPQTPRVPVGDPDVLAVTAAPTGQGSADDKYCDKKAGDINGMIGMANAPNTNKQDAAMYQELAFLIKEEAMDNGCFVVE